MTWGHSLYRWFGPVGDAVRGQTNWPERWRIVLAFLASLGAACAGDLWTALTHDQDARALGNTVGGAVAAGLLTLMHRLNDGRTPTPEDVKPKRVRKPRKPKTPVEAPPTPPPDPTAQPPAPGGPC